MVDGIFCSVLSVVHILLSLYRLRDWGPPKCWQPLAVAQSAPPVIRHSLRPLVLGVAGWAQGKSSRAMLPPACHNAAFTAITAAWPTALRKQRWGRKLLVTLQRVWNEFFLQADTKSKHKHTLSAQHRLIKTDKTERITTALDSESQGYRHFLNRMCTNENNETLVVSSVLLKYLWDWNLKICAKKHNTKRQKI